MVCEGTQNGAWETGVFPSGAQRLKNDRLSPALAVQTYEEGLGLVDLLASGAAEHPGTGCQASLSACLPVTRKLLLELTFRFEKMALIACFLNKMAARTMTETSTRPPVPGYLWISWPLFVPGHTHVIKLSKVDLLFCFVFSEHIVGQI